jgi:anti-sigma regulatory factor (Ser/Thr protein kinase)
MPGVRRRGEEIRKFALRQVEEHPHGLANLVAKTFSISQQTARAHLGRLTSGGLLTEQGATSNRIYFLRVLEDWQKTYQISSDIDEHQILDVDILPRLTNLAQNVQSIWSTAFTEMFNNVIDHSSATEATVEIRKTAINTEMVIHDNGVGIFKKIQEALNLSSERYAVVQLSKGKFTTDPSKHSGEDIFFTSKMFDRFDILSGGLAFSGDSNNHPKWVTDKFHGGTMVWMKLDNDSTREPKDVYGQFAAGHDEDFAFNKTAVPIKLAQVGPGGLVSRSQAKRVLAGIDRLKVVALDFTGVDWIGQGFADEIFRVYQNAHPDIKILVEGASPDVNAMIQRVKTGS